jgi:tetratricopeptide (TPR) repeat protein
MSRKAWKAPQKKLHKLLLVLYVCLGMLVLSVVVYFLPPFHERLSWWVDSLRAEIYYYFNPPDELDFTPAQQAEMGAIVQKSLTAMAPTPTTTMVPSLTPTNFVSPTPSPTASPTPSPTPLPSSARLEGVEHEFQKRNNCGPANLSMLLSYWGWEGDQYTIAGVLKPRIEDRNVMPYELVEYVNLYTPYQAVMRWGGDLELIKKFIAAGFPVLIEKGFQEEMPENMWAGHYGVVTAYDDATRTFLIQDSYVMADYPNSYEKVERHWRAFNYVYVIVYPLERENEVLALLGPQADETYNHQYAAQKAKDEISKVTGRELFFAWFNYGASLRYQYDYVGAAQAFDEAYEVYAELSSNPWRITWYRTDPFFAYYYTGRYKDLYNLADITLSYSSAQPAIEESWVWRGRAKLAMGDVEGAIEDFRSALEWHPNWWVAEQELQNLGVVP